VSSSLLQFRDTNSPCSVADVKSVHDTQGNRHSKGDCDGIVIESEFFGINGSTVEPNGNVNVSRLGS
jgi:hypothetical protein